MISMSAWKLPLVMPTPRPSRGPASQLGQPPLRAGTYCEGADATPAVNRKTVVSIPSSPSAPSARTARVPLRMPAAASVPSGGPAVV